MKQRDDWHLTDILHYEHGEGDPFAAAVRGTRMPMVITDPSQPDNPIVFGNEAFQKLTGYDRDEIIGRNCRFLQGPETDRATVARVRTAIEEGHSVEADLLNYRKDGSTFWNALYLSPVRSPDGKVQFFFASQLDVTARIEAQRSASEGRALVEEEVRARTADLNQALEAKTLLLHEVDHRVKNNLTMIGSLLRMQTRVMGDPAIARQLNAMLERVDALASVHRRLYQSDDLTRFDAGAFAVDLASDVVGASGRADIRLAAEVGPLIIAPANASALGLVVNEAITNAVKHGFADRSGVLSIRGHASGSSGEITISDDGPGDGMERGAPPGLGRLLMARLSRQVGGSVQWSDASPGMRVTIAFPILE